MFLWWTKIENKVAFFISKDMQLSLIRSFTYSKTLIRNSVAQKWQIQICRYFWNADLHLLGVYFDKNSCKLKSSFKSQIIKRITCEKKKYFIFLKKMSFVVTKHICKEILQGFWKWNCSIRIFVTNKKKETREG